MQNDPVQRKLLSPDEYVSGVLSGNRKLLSKAITLIESAKPEHAALAQEVIEKCLPHSGRSIRIAVTGVPGVGKSTFIEAFGKHLTGLGKRLAVLAIDPSSRQSKGSILGDKTRMEALANDENSFIRPSPTGGALGGVAGTTRETVILCEAAGFDVIIIETVGVGQSETDVHSMVDFFLLLMLAGAGDELQGIKRGIMELADAIMINKADGENEEAAKKAAGQYKNALHLFPHPASGWAPKVETCSAINGTGIGKTWEIIIEHHDLMTATGLFEINRQEQAKHWLHRTIHVQLKKRFFSRPEIRELLPELENRVMKGNISVFKAINLLFEHS